MPLKVLYFCRGQGNQIALANRIAACLPLTEIIVVDPDIGSHSFGVNLQNQISKLIRRGATAIVGLPLRRAWFDMLKHYGRQNLEFPTAPALIVADINASEVETLVGRTKPDLVIVSGTNLLKGPLIAAIHQTGKIMNLHTGISPYVRGAPNCTNWCMVMRRFDLIGNSVMWIDVGIDSGNLIATERTPLSGRETLTELHIKVMDHAHDLLLRCLRRFAEGKALPNVPQSELAEGKLFLARHWNSKAALRAVVNFYFRDRQARGGEFMKQEVKLVSLPDELPDEPSLP